MSDKEQKPADPRQASVVENFLNIVKSWGKRQTIEDLKEMQKSKSFDEDNLPIG
jgi:hypothetical protein